MVLGIDVSCLSQSKKTGVEWYTYFLLRELLLLIPDSITVKLYIQDPIMLDFGLPDHVSVVPLRWPPRFLWTQFRLSVEMLIDPPDVLFVPAHVIPLIHPKKTITTIHDIAAWRFPHAYSVFERWYSLFAARLAVRQLPAVLTPSAFTRDELSAYLGEETDLSHVHVTPLGIELSPVSTQHTDLSSLGITGPYCISIGRLEEKKNTRRIIEAFDLLKQDPTYAAYQLVLVGKPGFGYDEIETARLATACHDDIIIPDWIEPDVLSTLLGQASVCVFPSLYEGFGLPILEAFAAGIPVVTSQGSSTEEVGGAGALYVDPLSSSAIADGIRAILSSDKLRQRLIDVGHTRVLEYSWEHTALQTWTVIRSLFLPIV